MAGGKRNRDAQFTYDFGIAIAQSTVSKITRLTGATLTLASAFYALRSSALEYVGTLKENTLRFGGVLSTLKAIEQAQNRLIKGQSYFSVDDQLKGMNQLMAVGVDVGKNLEWINKAAHAMGKSQSEFSRIISSAIQGNSQALVDAGLMTQRATRMFDKYAANTIMRQHAILNFVKTHKGLMNAIKNDFETVQDQMTRIKGIWQGFLRSILGKPNDPQSFYGQVVSSMKMVATALANNMQQIERYGYIIGQTLGWVIKQIGHFVVWVGRQVKTALSAVWTVTDDFQNQTRSMLVWLEFWKLRIVDFFKEYGGTIKTILKILLIYKALKAVFVIGGAAIASVKAYRAALLGTIALQKRYIASMGPFIGKTAKFFQSLAVWLPKPFRGAWVWLGKFFADFSLHVKSLGRLLFGIVRNIPALIGALFNSLRAMWAALNATNPVGWVILAITALVVLYKKCEGFRVFVNNLFKLIWESIKFVWNLAMLVVTSVMAGFKKVWGAFKTHIWEPIAGFFRNVGNWIDNMWNRFMNGSVGKWIYDKIISPIKGIINWLLKWLPGANDNLSQITKELADTHGVVSLPTFGGGNYDTNDSTDYLSPKNWGSSTSMGNPILSTAGVTSPSSNGGESTVMNFGDINIQVLKGDGIDENKLAQKVKQVIIDLKREGIMRGGTV